jgi:hypothetical protein
LPHFSNDYGFAPVAAMPVRDPGPMARLIVATSDDGGCPFLPVSSHGVGLLLLFILHLYSLQLKFMLSLELGDPGDSLSTLLICHVRLARRQSECPGGRK